MKYFDVNIIWLILTIIYLREKYVVWLTFLMLDKYLNGIQIFIYSNNQIIDKSDFPRKNNIINHKILGPFIHCIFGKEILTNSNKTKAYLKALEQTVPGSTAIIAVSEFTVIDTNSFTNYNLIIHFERFANLTINDVQQKYRFSQSVRFYYASLRFSFYKKFFHSHPEYEYAMYSDEDSLILKNPFELLENSTDEVHVMYDFLSYSHKGHPNFHWLRAWSRVSSSKKEKCGIDVLQISLFDQSVKNRLPLNVGLMIGKTKYLIVICELISSIFECVGMFTNCAEQGLFNHLSISGQLDRRGIKLHPHTVQNGNLMSCPNYLTIDEFGRRINSGEIFVLHHYHWVSNEYVNQCNERVKTLISYVELKH